MKLKLFVLCHKDFESNKFDPSYMTKLFNYECHNKYDNLKDNFLYEAYMIYDVYENLDKYIDDDTKYIGFCHYRRYFNIDYNTSIQYLENNKSILTIPENLINIKKQFSNCHDKFDIELDLIGYIINNICSNYKQQYDSYINGEYLSKCNMFITSIDIFKKYIEWVFSIIDEYCKYHNFTNYKDVYKFVIEHNDKFPVLDIKNTKNRYNTIEYNARLGGYIIERLMGLFFKYNYPNDLIEVPIIMLKDNEYTFKD